MIYGYEENVTIGDKLLLAMIGALCTIMHHTAPIFSFFIVDKNGDFGF